MERLNTKMSVVCTPMYRFNMTLVRMPAGLSAETDKLILKFARHYKEPKQS